MFDTRRPGLIVDRFVNAGSTRQRFAPPPIGTYRFGKGTFMPRYSYHRTGYSRAVFAVSLLLMVIATVLQPQSSLAADDPNDCGEPGEYGVIVYEKPNFEGACQSFSPQTNVDSEILSNNRIGNDRVSSVRVGSAARAVLCEHEHLNGVCETFFRDIANLDIYRIRIRTSSLYVGPDCRAGAQMDLVPSEAILFTEPDYGGYCLALHAGENWSDLRASFFDESPVFDNSISSLRLGTDVEVELCEGYDYQGACHVFDTDVASIGSKDEFGPEPNTASSVIVS